MKRILITGANSYIGTSFEKWVSQWPEEYQVDSVGTRNGEWKKLDFSPYDTIFHVAGIAHIKETKENELIYYEVNRDLAVHIAKKAKFEKVKHFIFLSTMSVYGLDEGIITKDTLLNPKNAYGKSKLEAEEALKLLESDDFLLAILRPPMVYGKGCKGNYQMLSSFAKKIPVFPRINNQRSMIYIDFLSEFVKLIVDETSSGIFFPQNKEYVCTTDMVEKIAHTQSKRVHTTVLFNNIIYLFRNKKIFKKVFGNLVYEKKLTTIYVSQIEFDITLQYTEGESI